MLEFVVPLSFEHLEGVQKLEEALPIDRTAGKKAEYLRGRTTAPEISIPALRMGGVLSYAMNTTGRHPKM